MRQGVAVIILSCIFLSFGCSKDSGEAPANPCKSGYKESVDTRSGETQCVPLDVACVPDTCAGLDCGRMSDGCGGLLMCGDCPSGMACGVAQPHKCDTICEPRTCTDAGAECGAVSDGCGETLQCGVCTAPDTCGSEQANRCACVGESEAALCLARGLGCGARVLTDRCGVTREVECGSCGGAAACGAWMAGECGQVVCTAGGWCREVASDSLHTADIYGLFADAATGHTWALGASANASLLLRHDGNIWTVEDEFPFPAVALTGSGGDLWLVVNDGRVVRWAEGVATVVAEFAINLNAIAATSPFDVWAAGWASTGAFALHFDGSTWSLVDFGGWEDIRWGWNGVAALDWNSVWLVGDNTGNGSFFDPAGPLVGHYSGADWSILRNNRYEVNNLPTSAYLMGVWANGPSDLWAVGTGGTILHFDGLAWETSASGVSQDLFAVTGFGDNVWAAGAGGVLLRFSGGLWSIENSGTTKTIWSLAAVSQDEVWAGGDDGLLLHYRAAVE